MKVRDIMTKTGVSVSPGDTIKEAVRQISGSIKAFPDIENAGIKALPVIEGGKLIGIISMNDILKAIYPDYMSMMDLGEFTWDGMLESLAKEASIKKVSEFMNTELVTVIDDDSLMECVDKMLKHNISRLPVTNRQGSLLGMVYLSDIFVAVTKSVLE